MFASSSSVYGVNDHYPGKSETDADQPAASTKLSVKCSAMFTTNCLVSALSPCVLYRLRSGSAPDLAIHKFAEYCCRQCRSPCLAAETPDYTYVEDTVQGASSAPCTAVQSGFEIINLGQPVCMISLKELISGIEKGNREKPLLINSPISPATSQDLC